MVETVEGRVFIGLLFVLSVILFFNRCRRSAGIHTGWKCRNLKIEDHLEDVGLDGRITLKLIFGNTVANCGLD
jgi:hypothetical protein